MAGYKAHTEHAYPKRPGDVAQGLDHIVLDERFAYRGMFRVPGDALCKPRENFWGLSAEGSEATCPRCIDLASRYGVVVHTGSIARVD